MGNKPYITIGSAVLFCVVGVALMLLFLQVQSTTDSVHGVLCNIKQDRTHQLNQARRFLTEHPAGGFGFTTEEIRKEINDQSAILQSYESLEC